MITFTTSTNRAPSARQFGDFTPVPGRRNRGGRRRGPRPQESAKPVQTKPVPTKPVQTKPVQTKPVQTKPETLTTLGLNAGIEERLRARGIKLWSDDPDNF